MNIREICEKYEISQSGLARRFGIPLRTVQGWYLGERKPPEYVVGMIDELLQADVDAYEEELDDYKHEDDYEVWWTEGYDYSQHLRPDERYQLTKDGPLMTEDEVKAELRAQYLEQHPGASEIEVMGFVIARFSYLQRDRACIRMRAEQIREANKQLPQEKREEYFFGK